MPDYFDRLRSIIESVRSFAREYHGLRVAEVEVRFHDDKRPLRCYVPPSDLVPSQDSPTAEVHPPPPPRPLPAHELTDTQEAIMSVLRTATRPMKASIIARQARIPDHGYFRSSLKSLVEWGFIRRLPAHLYADASRLPSDLGESG